MIKKRKMIIESLKQHFLYIKKIFKIFVMLIGIKLQNLPFFQN